MSSLQTWKYPSIFFGLLKKSDLSSASSTVGDVFDDGDDAGAAGCDKDDLDKRWASVVDVETTTTTTMARTVRF